MRKKKWLGPLLSFFVPGLGNAYGRKVKKGIIIYLTFFVVLFSSRFIAYTFPLLLFSVTMIIVYLFYLLISGYRDVQRDKEYEASDVDKWYFYLLVILLHYVLFSSINVRTINELMPINFASIPTPAMEPTLMIGDILAYNKSNKIERNDVVLFWFPKDTQTLYIKRCVGLPGDSLQIKASNVLINNKPLTGTPQLKYRYLVTTDGTEIKWSVRKKYGIGEFNRISEEIYGFFLTSDQADKLKELEYVKKAELSIVKEGETDGMSFPIWDKYKWNVDFYGPIYIPRKGDKIPLTEKNIDLYLACIEFENESVEMSDSGLVINGKSEVNYEFKENYYFMMGDNRHNSFDSRYWGFLPAALVVGKTMYLYWGNESERIGKRIE